MINGIDRNLYLTSTFWIITSTISMKLRKKTDQFRLPANDFQIEIEVKSLSNRLKDLFPMKRNLSMLYFNKKYFLTIS